MHRMHKHHGDATSSSKRKYFNKKTSMKGKEIELDVEEKQINVKET
jgi:hypothetical protein